MKQFIFSLIILFAQGAFATQLSIEKVENYALDKPMVFYWENERPEVSDVALVVAHVGRDLARIRQSYNPVFFIDDRVAEKVKDLGDGRVVLIAPQGVRSDSTLWVGPKMLPEDIDRRVRLESFEKFLRNNPLQAQKVALSKRNRTFGLAPESVLPKPVLSAKNLYKKANSL